MNQRNGMGVAAPIMALLFCASASACNGGGSGDPTGAGGNDGSGDDGGAAGSMNTGGGGSGGNGGGMTTPVCSADQGKVALESWPWFGFEQAIPDPQPDLNIGAPATVTAVEAGGLRVTFDPGAMPVRLAWAGPDLNQVFAAGDMVTITTEPGVQAYRVTGAKGQAVVLRYANAQVPNELPAIPGGGPNLAMDVECLYEQVKTCPLPERRTLYGLTASLGNDSVIIPSGMTAKVGAWTLRHVKTMNVEFFVGMECTPDKFFDGVVHALEVKP